MQLFFFFYLFRLLAKKLQYFVITKDHINGTDMLQVGKHILLLTEKQLSTRVYTGKHF